MKKRILGLLAALCALLAGCQLAVPESSTRETTPSTLPPAVITTISTAPAYSIPPEREPVLQPPEVPQLPEDFFDDCAFVGDSVTYGLMLECMRTGDLGNVLFLATKSLGLHNSLFGGFTHSYQGQAMTTEEALAASGVKTVFIMLGMNDLTSIPPQQCADHFALLISRILEKCPDMEIYIQSCTPIYTGAESAGLTNANADQYNALLESFAQENGYAYIDIASYLKDQTGGIAHRYCSDDYVHLTSQGAQVWIAVLKSFLAQQGETHD